MSSSPSSTAPEIVAGLSLARDILDSYRLRSEPRLRALLDARVRQLESLPFGTGAYAAPWADYVLRGGKRVRGALVELGAHAVDPRADVLDASLSFELIHAYFLAFDDIMDRDELRRGGPALHVASTHVAQARSVSDAAHRGMSVTLLLGLITQSLAFERLSSSPAALGYFLTVCEGVTVGQLLDVCAADRPSASVDEVSAIHQLKTGLYTTEGPLVLGALLAGASVDGPAVAALRAYARPLGEAFQLIDDILGAVGASADTGKPASSDLREGKRTAVVEEALRRTVSDAPEWRALLLDCAGRPVSEARALQVREVLFRCGAIDAVRDRARQLAAQARSALDVQILHPEAVERLEAMSLLVVERQS